MGYSWWFINHTRKDIRYADPHNVLKTIQIFCEKYGWAMTDIIDIMVEYEGDPSYLVQKKGYKIESEFWY
jgi:hypothetical protein